MAKRGRGSNTHGHGQHKRGAGRRGGAGFAGSKDAHWVSTLKGGKLRYGRGRPGKYGHFGKRGFSRGGLSEAPATANLRWVDENFDKVADLSKAGIEKLLGTGKLTKPLKIVVASWSARAEEKVKAAGGELVKPK